MTLSLTPKTPTDSNGNRILWGDGGFGDRPISQTNTLSVFPSIPNPLQTSITLDSPVELFLDELAEMVQQLELFQPLYDPLEERRTLANNALTSLKKRQQEDITKLANRLAEDVSVVID